jgi:hypothetical protein
MTMTIDDIVDLIHANHHRQLEELLAIFRPDRFPESCSERDITIAAESYRNQLIEEAQWFLTAWPIIDPTECWPIWTELRQSRDEVFEWGNENLQGYWDYDTDLKVICFEKSVDEVFFKLRWR